MSEALWNRIIREVAREAPDAELWPTFYGEALMLGRRIYDRIRVARELGLTRLVLNSNGSFLRDCHIDEILTCGLRTFILSLDGLTRETFEHVRYTLDPHGKHQPVYEGARQLLRRKHELDRRGVATPTIVCQFSRMQVNQHEAEAFRDYWLGLGAHVKFREMLTWTGFVPAANLTHDFTERIACPWGNNTMAIHWNGDVVVCAVDNEGRHVVGNVASQSIRTIWTTALRSLRRTQRAHRWSELPPLCRDCLDWQAVGASHYTPDGREYHSICAGMETE